MLSQNLRFRNGGSGLGVVISYWICFRLWLATGLVSFRGWPATEKGGTVGFFLSTCEPCGPPTFSKREACDWWSLWFCFWIEATLQSMRKASVSSIYCTVGHYKNLREVVFANRGVMLASVNTRRAPNAFNLIRQAEVLAKAGHGTADQQFEVRWVWWCFWKKNSNCGSTLFSPTHGVGAGLVKREFNLQGVLCGQEWGPCGCQLTNTDAQGGSTSFESGSLQARDEELHHSRPHREGCLQRWFFIRPSLSRSMATGANEWSGHVAGDLSANKFKFIPKLQRIDFGCIQRSHWRLHSALSFLCVNDSWFRWSFFCSDSVRIGMHRRLLCENHTLTRMRLGCISHAACSFTTWRCSSDGHPLVSSHPWKRSSWSSSWWESWIRIWRLRLRKRFRLGTPAILEFSGHDDCWNKHLRFEFHARRCFAGSCFGGWLSAAAPQCKTHSNRQSCIHYIFSNLCSIF